MLVCYKSYEDKAARWVPSIGFGIVREAVRGSEAVAAALRLAGVRDVRGLHAWLQTGLYVAETGSCDDMQSVATTLLRGGDCEDWAAVALAGLWALGVAGRVVGGGDSVDPYRHVWIEAWTDDGWRALDAKPHQDGYPFGETSRWASTVVVWSPDVVQGSGADEDPLIKCEADANKWMKPEQMKFYLERVKKDKGTNAYMGTVNALKGCYHSLRRSQILAFIGASIDASAATIAAKTGAYVAGASAFANLVEAKTLGEVNMVMAAEYVATYFDGVGTAEANAQKRGALRQYAMQVGGNPTASDQQLAAVAAFYIAQQATARGIVLDDWLAAVKSDPEAVRRNPQAVIAALQASEGTAAVAGSAGSVLAAFDKGFKKLITHPLKWARQVFVTEVGKGIRALAENLLDAEQNVPWLGQFFLKPLGFHAQAVILQQIGAAMVDGSIATFDETAVASAAGETFVAAGQAFVAASGFLPAPWNVAALAIGVLSIAVGETILYHVDKAQDDDRARAKAEAQARYDAAMAEYAEQQRRAIPAGWADMGNGWIYGQWSDGRGWAGYVAARFIDPDGWTIGAWWNGKQWVMR